MDVRHCTREPGRRWTGFNVLALGIASTIYRRAMGNSAVPESIAMFHPLHIRFLSDIPLIGPAIFGQTILFI